MKMLNLFFISQNKIIDQKESYMQQVQAVPIKHLSFQKTWIYRASESTSNKVQRQKNSRNFLFMRVINHERKKKENKMSTTLLMPFDTDKEVSLPVRPKTSLLKGRNVEEFAGDSVLALPRQNPETIRNHRASQIKRSHTPCNETSSEGFKNYFPLRKPKKNKDFKWHQYYTLLSMKDFTLEYTQPVKLTEKQKTYRKNTQKTHRRTRTSMANPKTSPEKPKQSLLRNFNIEISPWNTTDVHQKPPQLHEHSYKMIDYS